MSETQAPGTSVGGEHLSTQPKKRYNKRSGKNSSRKLTETTEGSSTNNQGTSQTDTRTKVNKIPQNDGSRNRAQAQKGSSSAANDSNADQKKKKNNNNNKNKKNNNYNKLKVTKLNEIASLLGKFPPITINGLPTKSLTVPPIEYITQLHSKKVDTYISILIAPSDPQFAFDLQFLNVSLYVSWKYPTERPQISVLNDELGRGFGINVENGFKGIVETAVRRSAIQKKKKTNDSVSTVEDGEEELIELVGDGGLLSLILTLDKYLEKFLSMEKKDTIKFVKMVSKKKPQSQPTPITDSKNTERKEKKKPVIDDVQLLKRQAEINKMLQRLRHENVKLFKETGQSSIYKLSLKFPDEPFTIGFENQSDLEIESLNVKLTIPKDYLSNLKKSLRLEIDMSNDANLKMINSIEDKDTRFIVGKLFNNLNNNFNFISQEFIKTGTATSWSITAQFNLFIQNFEKFLNDQSDFKKWIESNTLLNKSL